MSEWKEYTRSDEQIEEINNAPHGYSSRLNKKGKTEYLIHQPHPYANLIKTWADTGCQVWIKAQNFRDLLHIVGTLKDIQDGNVLKTTKPDWNIPGAEYSLTPFKD